MTDQPQSPDSEGTGPEQEATGAGPGGMPTGSDFTSGEGMVALAGIILLINFVIFELIMAEYFISYPLLLLAVAAAVLPRLRRESVEAFHPLGQIMKVIGYAIVILGVFEILDDIRFDGYDEAAAIFGALVAYAGYAVAFLGARSIKS
jgi:hypothetical protein